ncbi:hypothetical protein LRR81_05615 [Metabacillus sp. GX 13764]|uniref:hypothetical protein n=1 Tax=Metabacillus kandeliae TaxID=2900151 RepID=UPI001E31936E|nr:hypothetical protein [Metabacillus kandeliae]MCD7033703.1 hypothetical protein [Metabacillus kandeliae]
MLKSTAEFKSAQRKNRAVFRFFAILEQYCFALGAEALPDQGKSLWKPLTGGLDNQFSQDYNEIVYPAFFLVFFNSLYKMILAKATLFAFS